MATVRQILKTKGYRVCSVRLDDSILDALHVMAENEIGAVLVMQDEDILGIFSERDYARRGILKGNPPETPVSKLMTSLISVSYTHLTLPTNREVKISVVT